MAIFLLIVMALLLIAALERNNRRQSPHASGLHGADAHDDRDWARVKLDMLAVAGEAEPFARKPMARILDMLALAGEAEPFARKPMAVKRQGQLDTPILRHTTKPALQHWNTKHHNGPRAA
jgi:hypothetical protein